MTNIRANIEWTRTDAAFQDNRYSRAHVWRFDGGAEIPASSSPDIVPLPMSDASAVDPEEAFLAAISSCHMLWFLSIAAKSRFVVDAYSDNPIGELRKNAAGKLVVDVVTLYPRVSWSKLQRPKECDVMQLHERAHANCFIANSINSTLHIQPVAHGESDRWRTANYVLVENLAHSFKSKNENSASQTR